MSTLLNYKKFIAQLVATVAVAAIPMLADDNMFSLTEKINIVVVALGALGVLGAGNLPAGIWKYMKGYVAAGSAVAVYAVSALGDGAFTHAEILQAVLAALGAVGVVAVKGPVVQEFLSGRHSA
jgi:hypothetical protein